MKKNLIWGYMPQMKKNHKWARKKYPQIRKKRSQMKKNPNTNEEKPQMK